MNGRGRDAQRVEACLGITPAAAADAYEYGAWMHWLQGLGDPVFSLRLLKAGRRMIAREIAPHAVRPLQPLRRATGR
jgi:hypothetical protein